jgi:hypothetical protein
VCGSAVLAGDALGENRRIENGADLEKACTSAEPQDRQRCADYIDRSLALDHLLHQQVGQCLFYDPPQGLTTEEAIAILTDWLREHRDRGEIAATYVLTSAMKDSFPCNR